MSPEDALRQSLESVDGPRTLWVAYSGGLDSHVLLHALTQILRSPSFKDRPLKLIAAHIHHGLHEAADHWTQHCETVCGQMKIPCRVIRVDAQDTKGLGPEQAARNARYAALTDLLTSDDCLLTAHHQDDQSETLLLQLMRGAGPEGLAAMPARQTLGAGQLLRPFLSISRQTLQQYADQHQLDWIEDPSNLDTHFDRNFIRHQIMPVLKTRWPAITETTARTARLCADTQKWIETQTDDVLRDQPLHKLSLDVLQAQPEFGQRFLFRAWLKRAGLRPPSYARLRDMLAQCLDSNSDRQPAIQYQGFEIRRFHNHIYLLRELPKLTAAYYLEWQGDCSLLPNGLGSLNIQFTHGQGVSAKKWRDSVITVRPRAGGERLSISGRDGHHSLKHLFQETGVPPWVRERIPLIYSNETLIAVADLWVDAAYAAQADEAAVRIEWIAPWRDQAADRN